MGAANFGILPSRAPLAVTGTDAHSFLQGLISNDVTRVGPRTGIYAALLTPQGKFLHDLFVIEAEGALVLDAEAARLDDLVRRLKMFKLRAKVDIAPLADRVVAVAWGEGADAALAIAGAYPDPRLAEAGVRAVLPAADARRLLADAGLTESDAAGYDRHRLGLGLPDGSRDMEVDKAVLLECGFEELNGVDFDKGCYMGQELTARTKYRGLVKKRLLPVAIEGTAPPPGTQITLADRDAGELRSSRDGLGLALIRLDALDKAQAEGLPLMAGATPLAAWTPSWMTLPGRD